MLSTIKSAIAPVLALVVIGVVGLFLYAHPELLMIGRGL